MAEALWTKQNKIYPDMQIYNCNIKIMKGSHTVNNNVNNNNNNKFRNSNNNKIKAKHQKLK